VRAAWSIAVSIPVITAGLLCMGCGSAARDGALRRYEERVKQLESDDVHGRIELGHFCRRNQLLDFAEHMAREANALAPTNRDANALLQVVTGPQAEAKQRREQIRFEAHSHGIAAVVAGLVAMTAALGNWHWFMGHPDARPVVKSLGRSGARVWYCALGLGLIVLGLFLIHRGVR